jgi:hydroxyethylthiazole kinase-like uncharacterized protein yjeF
MRDISDIFEPVYLRHEIAEIEQRAAIPLMERAGRAAAQFVSDASAEKVLVLAGPGNNGGDAFVCARLLQSWWMHVDLVFIGSAEKLPKDAALAYDAWIASGGICLDELPEGKWDMVVDGLFGTGLKKPLEGDHARLVERINALGIPVLSIDMPSGVDADTGAVLGHAIRASHTLTFIGLKPGLLTSDGPDHCGIVQLDALGISPPDLLKPQGWVSNSNILSVIEKRPKNSHKGTFGSVAVIGGSKGMAGAGLLAARAALKLGSGKVFLGTDALEVDLLHPEIMVRNASELIGMGTNAIVIGPGLGRSEGARRLVEAALESECALVIDADALNLISEQAALQEKLAERKRASVLTPHPLEAARLLNADVSDILKNRIETAKKLCLKFKCPALLKGAGSILAHPDGTWAINASGNAGLAQAGTGDVLSGMIAALIAQGLDASSATLCAVYLHGAAAEKLAEESRGPVGMSASEVTDAARMLLNEWVYRARSGTL